MPTYQYVCTQCGAGLEAQQTFSDASLTVCPTCEGRLRKVFAAVGVVFKGSGFYRNDSRESAKAGAGDAAKSSGGEATASTNGSSSDASATAGSGSSDSSSGSGLSGSNGSSSGSSGTSKPAPSSAPA